MPVNIVKGKRGQFEIVVDGKMVAKRSGNFLTKILGSGWPDPDTVVNDVKEAINESLKD